MGKLDGKVGRNHRRRPRHRPRYREGIRRRKDAQFVINDLGVTVAGQKRNTVACR